jgi:hypothetical protein
MPVADDWASAAIKPSWAGTVMLCFSTIFHSSRDCTQTTVSQHPLQCTWGLVSDTNAHNLQGQSKYKPWKFDACRDPLSTKEWVLRMVQPIPMFPEREDAISPLGFYMSCAPQIASQ